MTDLDVGLLVIRVAVGVLVASHGAQKLFGWWGGGGRAGTARMFDAIGLRPGRVTAILGGIAELGGGLFLAAGLLTPLACLAIIVMMIGAVVAVHLPKGWWNTAGGMEFPVLIAVTALGLTLSGPGPYSVDRLLGLSWSGAGWAFGVCLAATVLGAVIVAILRSGRMPTVGRSGPIVPDRVRDQVRASGA
jgi:putative oxidoreductase